jgi:ABC-type branched-subunit amino acid transport system ATPase component/ABC-type branched-subunit amino acid transport system permease subunit
MRRLKPSAVVGIVVALGLFVWPYLGHSQVYELTRLEYIFTGLMVAIGLNIVTGYAGQLSLGPGAVYAVGGYAAAIVANDHPTVVGLAAMCGVALVASGVLGLVIGVPSLRVGGFYLGMTTLFFALVIPTVVSNMKLTGKEQGISLLANIDFHQKVSGVGLYQLTLATVIVLLVLSWWLLESRLGHRFVTLATSEELASSLGIAPYRTKLLAFVLSALPAGIGGAFYAYTQQFIAPGSVSPQLSIYLLAACVVGGFGTVLGPLVGGLLVIGLSQYLGRFEQYEGIVFGIVLIVFAVGLPEGIMGFDPRNLRIRPAWLRAFRLPGIGGSRTEPITPRDERVSVERAAVDGIDGLLSGVAPEPLVAQSVSRAFGGVRALDGVDVTVRPGTIHGLVGSNGSGKTTLLNVISGFYPADTGCIRVGSVRIDRRSTHQIAAAGIARTFQTPKLVERASLVDNVVVAIEQAGVTRGRRAAVEQARRCLAAVGLETRADERAATQSHGTRRLVEVARALALRPGIVLLDEPGAGLSAAEVDVLRDVIVAIARAGSGVLIVEHNVPLVLDIADEVTALHEGRVIATGLPGDVAAHPDVVAAFLGTNEGLVS